MSTTMTREEKFVSEFQSKLNKARKEDTVEAYLKQKTGQDTKFVYAHDKYTMADFPAMPLNDAIELAKKFDIIEVENWVESCRTVAPREVNSIAKHEKGVKEGEFLIELLMRSYGNRAEYKECSLIFWTKMDDMFLKINILINNLTQAYPRTNVTWTFDGQVSTFSVGEQNLKQDHIICWWSPKPTYNISYYWKTWETFTHKLAELTT